MGEMNKLGLGLKVGELWVGVLLYADDLILMAESEEHLAGNETFKSIF